MDPIRNLGYGLAGMAAAGSLESSLKIKTAEDYLDEAYDALKSAAGLLIAHGERKRAQWVLKAMNKVADAQS